MRYAERFRRALADMKAGIPEFESDYGDCYRKVEEFQNLRNGWWTR